MKQELLKGKKIHVIGAGLAGSEAAYFLANCGALVTLFECKRQMPNPSQRSPYFCELVCSNSLKSSDHKTAHGHLKWEMEQLNSLVIDVAKNHSVGAGSALAVNRDEFSLEITNKLEQHPNIQVVEKEITSIKSLLDEADTVIVATGPLTSEGFYSYLQQEFFDDPSDLYFYDAVAPIVDGDTLNYDELYFKDRWQDERPPEESDYLNVPLNKKQYLELVNDLRLGTKKASKDFEEMKYFESCLPVDLMAERGEETLRFSCMRPVGLKTREGELPYAVIQLRKENLLGTAFNMVGFQTRLLHNEQKRIFRKLPGFKDAEFFHLGSVHRNSYLNASKLLNHNFSAIKEPKLFFAGQLTGVEGYTESAAHGLFVALQVAAFLRGQESLQFPVQTLMGALFYSVKESSLSTPLNANFGLLPPIDRKFSKKDGPVKEQKRKVHVERARASFIQFSKEALASII